jgi:hypothetical protein
LPLRKTYADVDDKNILIPHSNNGISPPRQAFNPIKLRGPFRENLDYLTKKRPIDKIVGGLQTATVAFTVQ